MAQVAEEDMLRADANVLFSLDFDLTLFTAFRRATLLAHSDMVANGNTRQTFAGKSIGGGGLEVSDGHECGGLQTHGAGLACGTGGRKKLALTLDVNKMPGPSCCK